MKLNPCPGSESVIQYRETTEGKGICQHCEVEFNLVGEDGTRIRLPKHERKEEIPGIIEYKEIGPAVCTGSDTTHFSYTTELKDFGRCIRCKQVIKLQGISEDYKTLPKHHVIETVDGTNPTGPGGRKDDGKCMVHLISPHFLFALGDVLTFGINVNGYQPRNWERGIQYSRCIASTLRHIFYWMAGERRDSTSGLSHLAHAACNLMFLVHYETCAVYEKFDDIPDNRRPDLVWPKEMAE